MEPEIFQEPEQPEVFIQPNVQGSGFKSIDDFIADRAALMDDQTDVLRNLNVAQQNVTHLDHEGLRSYVNGLSAKAYNDIAVDVVEHYANTGEVDVGVQRVKQLQDAAGEDLTDVRKLANASAEHLDRFERYSIPREVARRQYAALLISKKLEEVGITPDKWHEVVTGVLGAAVPVRRTWQHLTSDIDLDETVQKLHRMKDEDFLKAMPDIMDEVMKMSGENPFYFMERMKAYLDPEDLKMIKVMLGADVVDSALIFANITKLAKLGNLVKAKNTPIKILRDSGQVGRAAELNVAALGDNGAAAGARTTQADAAQSTSPFGGEGLDPNINERIAAESQAIIAAKEVETQTVLAPLHDPNFLIRKTYYTPEEVARANTKYLNQFAGKATVKEQLDDGALIEVAIEEPNSTLPSRSQVEKAIDDTNELMESGQFDKVELLNQRAKLNKLLEQVIDYESKVEMHRLNPTRTVQVKYRNNDFGELEAIQYDKAVRFLNSPLTYVEQMMHGLVGDATQIDYQTARIMDIFRKAHSVAVGGMRKKQRLKLDSILLQGDKDGVVYTELQLAKGIRTPEGVIKLDTAEEIGAYKSMRIIYDDLFEHKNIEMGKTLDLGGFKAVYPKVNGEKQLNFTNPNKIVPLEDRATIKRIYNFETNQVENVADIKMKKVLDWEVYELKHPLDLADETINYILAKPKHIKPRPRYVLNKRLGYVTKIDKDVFWVAEMIGPRIVNGNRIEDHRTVVRYFDNPLDANTWVDGQKAKGVTMDLRSGREWLDQKPGRREEFESQIFGGLYGGKRAEGSVPFGLEGTEAERVGAIEAMEAYMNHIATRMPAVQFRASLIQRFLNSAKGPDGKSYLQNPGDWRSEILQTTPHKEKSGLKAMQDWISDQMRIPTTQERVWGDLQQKVAEMVTRVPGTGRTMAKWAMNIGAKDMFTRLRGLSFHATLGWFNFRQLFVQAMGASLAMSMDPIGAPARIAKSLALRAAMFAQGDDAIMRIGKWASFADKEDFLRMVKAYQRTGLHEATLTTGDYAALQGFPHGAETFRYLADKGLLFFKEGERFARNYAWIQAYDEVTKGGKIVGNLTDEMISRITDRHLVYTMNLNRANRAAWQKGFLSIPTQFWQISTKFIENMLPDMILKNPHGWTGKEKAMILTGQLALFGSAGIPFGKYMYNNLANWLKSEDEFGLAIKDPEVLTAVQGGLTEMMLYRWTGERLDITNSLSIPAGIEQMIEIMTSENKDTTDLVLGVTSEIGSRTWDAVRLNSMILWSVMKDPEGMEGEVALEVLSNTASIVSSWRNYQKARLWERLNYIPNRDGKPIVPIDDENDRLLLYAQSIGLPPKIIDDYYNIKFFQKATEEDYRAAAVGVIQIGQRYMNDPDIITNVKKQKRMTAEIQIMLLGFTEAERAKILKQVDERRKNENYLLPEAMEKALDLMYDKGGAPDLQSNVTMVEP